MSRKFEGNTSNDKDEETLGSFYMGRMQPAEPENERVLPRGLLASIVVVVFAAIIWYAYPDAEGSHDAADVPVITADTTSYKFKPDDPGGMEVRHQDSTVFNPLVKKPAEDVERLLPKPEEPMDKADVLQAEKTATAALPEGNQGLNLEPANDEGEGVAEKVVPAAKEEPAKVEAAPTDSDKKTLTELATAKTEDTPVVAEKVEEEKPAEVKEEVKAEEPKVAEKAEVAAPVVSGSFYMQLGAFRDSAKADEEWRKLQKKFPQTLSTLDMRLEKADLAAKGIWYRLYAGPVAESKARDICSKLKSENASGCIVRKL